MTDTDWGAMAQDWLARLATCSAPGPGVTRLPFTPEHRAALDMLRALMQQAGLSVHLDAAGTLIGRQEGPEGPDGTEGPEGAPVLLLGSHQDSVREGGAYDGIMGVVLPILALMKLRAQAVRLPFAVEVLAFADEEGVRFPTALMGPRALAGTFDMAALEMQDRDGVSLRRAMEDFGLAPDDLPQLRRDRAQVLGWIETHLEQGPVLESTGHGLGIVTAICGIERHIITLRGTAAHAGTMPMALRRDALAGASALVLAVEGLAQARAGVLATVGALALRPGVVNAVPGEVTLTVELRAPNDADRSAAAADLAIIAQDIAKARNLGLEMSRSYAQAATPCADQIILALGQAAMACGHTAPLLPSGATHDSSAMADLCPVGMIFTRCRGGISHHPEEYVDPAAMAQAIATLEQTIRGFAAA
jgi:allantoate deiminase